MKFVAIFITLVLFGGMGYLMMDARNTAKGVTNELELMRRQQAATQADRAAGQQAAVPSADPAATPGKGAGKRPAPTPEQLAAAARESESLMQGAATSIPQMPPAGVAPGGPGIGAPSPGAAAGAIPGAPVAPLPPTPRQRQVMSAPAIAKVTEVQVESGFLVISAGSGRKIEKGMPFAIRRGDAIVARVKVTLVEEGNAVADIVRESIPVGVTVQQGDDVIQDLPPL